MTIPLAAKNKAIRKMGYMGMMPWQEAASKAAFKNQDEAYWLSKVGPLAGRLMQWAAYPSDEQLRVLAFIRDHIVPFLGPPPSPTGEFVWKTALHYDHTPVQLSLNMHKGRKTLRTANIPIDAESGTARDPANQQPSIDMVRAQQVALPGQDLGWFDKCVERFFLPAEAVELLRANLPEAVFQQAVQCMISHDYLRGGNDDSNSAGGRFGGIQCKVEFCPALKSLVSGHTVKEEIWAGIAALRGGGGGMEPYARSLALLERFVDSPGAAERGVFPIFFAFDTVPNEGYPLSRLKVYFATRKTALADVLYVYTLGGLLLLDGNDDDSSNDDDNNNNNNNNNNSNDVSSSRRDGGPGDVKRGVDALRRLWREVVRVPDGLGDEQDLPENPHPCAAVSFNFEIMPGAGAPVPKVYIPAHHYGKGDLEIAEGMDRFFATEGLDERYREEYTKCFVNAEGQIMAVHHDISMSYKNGSPYITSYFKPELHAKIE